MTASAISDGSAQRGGGSGTASPAFSQRPSASRIEISEVGRQAAVVPALAPRLAVGARGARGLADRGRAAGVLLVAVPSCDQKCWSSSRRSISTSRVRPSVEQADQALAQPAVVRRRRPAATALCSLSQKRSWRLLAVRTICSCSAGGVLSIRRTIEAVRARMCLRSAVAQRRPALVGEDQEARRLGQHQGEQQERDQLAGEAPRPEPPQDLRARASCRAAPRRSACSRRPRRS